MRSCGANAELFYSDSVDISFSVESIFLEGKTSSIFDFSQNLIHELKLCTINLESVCHSSFNKERYKLIIYKSIFACLQDKIGVLNKI